MVTTHVIFESVKEEVGNGDAMHEKRQERGSNNFKKMSNEMMTVISFRNKLLRQKQVLD